MIKDLHMQAAFMLIIKTSAIWILMHGDLTDYLDFMMKFLFNKISRFLLLSEV